MLVLWRGWDSDEPERYSEVYGSFDFAISKGKAGDVGRSRSFFDRGDFWFIRFFGALA